MDEEAKMAKILKLEKEKSEYEDKINNLKYEIREHKAAIIEIQKEIDEYHSGERPLPHEKIEWHDKDGLKLDPMHIMMKGLESDVIKWFEGKNTFAPAKPYTFKIEPVSTDDEENCITIEGTLFNKRFIYELIEELTGTQIFEDDENNLCPGILGREITLPVRSGGLNALIMIVGTDFCAVLAHREESN